MFFDSVGIIARINKDDKWHAIASPRWDALAVDGVRPVTTTFVLAECGNAFARTAMRSTLAETAASLLAQSCVVHPTEADWSAAWSAYVRGAPGGAGLVDHISFVVMRRLGLTTALTNDRHFSAAGFEVLF